MRSLTHLITPAIITLILAGTSCTMEESSLAANQPSASKEALKSTAISVQPVISTPVVTAPKIDEVLAQCPSAAEIASIDTDIKLQFDADPTTGTLVCTSANGSVDLTRLQERAYQAILMMKKIEFSQPLPWTDKPLYDWFVGAIDGIRFPGDIEFSFCCDPENFINIQTNNLSALQTNRWIDPKLGTGLQGLMVLFVHEARHNENFPHTCGAEDNTISEMGAWGVQYHLLWWLAFYSDRNFNSPTDVYLYPAYYQELALGEANWTREIRFCIEPAMTPGSTPTLFP